MVSSEKMEQTTQEQEGIGKIVNMFKKKEENYSKNHAEKQKAREGMKAKMVE